MTRFIPLALVWMATWLQGSTGTTSNTVPPLKLSVYPAAHELGPAVFKLAVAGSEAQPVSASPIDPARPLLLIVDPTSYPKTELSLQLSHWGAALARSQSVKPSSIRVGVAVLDGVLSDPMSGNAVPAALDRVVANYIVDSSEATDSHAGRLLDLIAALVEKAAGDNPIDCIVIARDRETRVGASGYVSRGISRRVSARLVESGSTIYGHLSGSGDLSEVIREAGGEVFGSTQQPESVLAHIAVARASGLVLTPQKALDSRFEGWLPVSIQGAAADGTEVRLRSPQTIWWVRDGSPAPDSASVSQSLELLQRVAPAQEGTDISVQEALALDPWNPAALLAAARVALAGNNEQRAGEYASRALMILPVDTETVTAYCDLALKTGHWKETRDNVETLRARRCLNSSVADRALASLLSASGEYADSIRYFDRLFQSAQNVDPELQAEYAYALLKTGKTSDAERLFTSAREAGSRNPRLMLGQSELAAAQGKLDDAVRFATQALQDSPGSPDALMQLTTLQLRRKEWSEAIRVLDSATPPHDSRFLLLRAEAEIGAGRTTHAGELLVRALASRPAAPSAYGRLADLQLKIGMVEDAAQSLESGASMGGPAEAGPMLLRAAEIRERRGEFGQALLDYRAALTAAPEHTAALSSHIEFLSSMVRASDRPAAQEKTQQSPVLREKADTELIVPGGRQLLARTLGVDVAALSRPDAADRLFAHILEMTPNNDRLRENPIATAVTTCLRDYDALLKHLVKLRLIHPEQDLSKPAELVFPLAGRDVNLARTADFLAFFGVHHRAPKRGTGDVELTLSHSKNAESRLRLLRNLGVDLMNRNLREIRITVRNDRMPLLLGSDVWTTQILRGTSRPDLLRSIVQSSDAMRLYVALARCSNAFVEALRQPRLAGEALRLSRAISVYGPSLEFSDGNLILPGSTAAWESLMGTPSSDHAGLLLALLDRDQGRALLLYQALSSASEPVRRYLTSSPARLAELYQLLGPYDASRLASVTGDTGRQDLWRLLRLASADDQGIYFEVPARIARLISTAREQLTPTPAASGPQGRYVDLPTLIGFMERGSAPTAMLFSTPVDLMELLRYLKQNRPELLADSALPALLQNPGQTPLFLDLIWHVGLEPDVAVHYIAYCRSLAEAGNKGWNVDKTRSSQAFFYVLSALCRERILARREANRILETAIAQFETDSESAFARNLASILNREVLPAVISSLGESAGDRPILRALAGRPGKDDIHFEGRYLRFDAADLRSNRMTTAIQQQTAAPLSKVLEAYKLLRRLDSSAGDIAAAQQLTKLLHDIGSVQAVPRPAAEGTRRIARADTQALCQKIQGALQKGEVPASLRDHIAAELNVELGVSLLAYCYADNATQDTTILAFDPNFVREHTFYPEVSIHAGIWRRAYVSQDEGGNSIMTGSLAGLRDELTRLETLQSGQSFGAQGAGVVPVLLSGVRGLTFSDRSDRAQEYVALSVRLGLELALAAARDPALRSWLMEQTRPLLGARRRELLLDWIARAEPSLETQVFSRSELFLIGRRYLAGRGAAPEFSCPVLDKVRSITPQPASADLAQFEAEIDQYGPTQSGRSGLGQPSFAFAGSYETLETNVRANLLFERICDLKVRIAELNYAFGLPARLAAFEGELALKDIVPENDQLNATSWRMALERIARLDASNVRRWVEELVLRGWLNENLVEQTEATEVSR